MEAPGGMAKDASRTAAAGDEPAAERLEWTVFLFARYPARGIAALAVVAFTIWFVWSVSRSAWLTGLAAFLLISSLASFLFPTRFTMDGESVTMRNALSWRRRRWSEFRGLRHDGRRLRLLTLPGNSRLDHYRGMMLLLPEDKERVLDFARRRLARRRDAES